MYSRKKKFDINLNSKFIHNKLIIHQLSNFVKSNYRFEFYLTIVGSKNPAAPTHFIQGPRPMLRRKKHSRMNKESPNCQEISLRTILSLANRNCKKEEWHALKDSLPGCPKQKVLTQWASHGSMVEEQF